VAQLYEVAGLIASGELSTVYRVRHIHGMEFAMRVLNAQLMSVGGATREMIERAERWLALAPHPNIAVCYQVQSVTGQPLIIAELVEGPTLRMWADGGAVDRVDEAVELALQVCRALQHAHRYGIAHGACTPENIRIAAGGVAKVMDFGVPLTNDQVGTAAGGVRGSDTVALAHLMRAAPYVAPECWHRPGAVAAAADVFALGACLWELFAGTPPYDSTATVTPQRLPAFGSETSAALRRLEPLLQRCVAWDVADRPTSMEEVTEGLSRIVAPAAPNAAPRTEPPVNEADQLNARAVTALYGERVGDAQEAWAAALHADPAHLDAFFNQAIAQWRHGSITDAELLRRIEAHGAGHIERWIADWLTGIVHLERGDIDAAQAVLERAHERQPGQTAPAQVLERVRLHRADATPSVVAVDGLGIISAVDVSGDGSLAVIGDSAGATIWDVREGACLQSLVGHEGGVSAAALSADGRAVATGGQDGTIRVWDVATGTCQRVFSPAAGQITSVSVSGDGELLLWTASHEASAGSAIQLWSVRSGNAVQEFTGQTAPIRSAMLSSDGRHAVSGGDDHAIRLWDIRSGKSRAIDGHTHPLSGVCLSADNALIVSASWDKTVRLWDRRTARCLRILSGHDTSVAAVSLTADGAWGASGDLNGVVCLWELPTGRCLRTIRAHTAPITDIAISAGGHRIISAGLDRSMRAWNTSPDAREPYVLRVDTQEGPRSMRRV
jgi:hypothetical protein